MATKEITLERIIDEVEVLYRVELRGVTYDIVAPEDLPEKYYIQFMSAKSNLLEIFQNNTTFETLEDGSVKAKTIDDPVQNARMEGAILPYTRNYIESLLQLSANSLELSQRLTLKLYNKLDSVIADYYRQKYEETKKTKNGRKKAEKETQESGNGDPKETLDDTFSDS